MTTKSGYRDVCICVGFLQKVFCFGKTSNRDKNNVNNPSGEIVCGETAGYTTFLFSSVFFPVLLKKSSVSNKCWFFSLEIRPKKNRDVKWKTIFLRISGNSIWRFHCLLTKTSKSRHGRVRYSRENLSSLSS